MSGCEIFGSVENSILASNVIVKKGAVVKNSIIMGDVTINENSVIEYSIIDENVSVGNNAVIGESIESNKGITVLGRNITVADDVVIEGGKIVDSDVLKEGN